MDPETPRPMTKEETERMLAAIRANRDHGDAPVLGHLALRQDADMGDRLIKPILLSNESITPGTIRRPRHTE